MRECTTPHQRDLLSSPWKAILFWGLPWILVIIGGNTGATARTVLWTVAFAGVGVACLANARRCGRRHCFYTGPLFLAAALASVLYGLDLLPLGHNGWNWIAGTAGAGALILCCGLDILLGKYVTTRGTNEGSGKDP